jgi:hypothetical protein
VRHHLHITRLEEPPVEQPQPPHDADGFIKDLERVEGDPRYPPPWPGLCPGKREPLEGPTALSPLAQAVRDYLERNPHDAQEPAGWIANTLWCLDLVSGKPTREEVLTALAEIPTGAGVAA